MDHRELEGAGQVAHDEIDRRLPDEKGKEILADLIAGSPPVTVTGSRGGNAALASLLTALEALGLITDSTS